MAADLRARATLGILAVAAVVVLLLILRPIALPLFLGAMLATVLRPLFERLSHVLRQRRRLAAGLVTIGVLLAIIGPLTWLASVLVHQVVQAVHWVRDALAEGGLEALVAHLPDSVEKYARGVLAELPEAGERLRALGDQGLAAVGAVGGVVSATGRLVLQIMLMLIALFFLLTDGPQLANWLDQAVPLRPGQLHELLGDFRKVTRAVVVSTVATAGSQTLVALLGYFIAGVPQALVFAFVTFLAALIPAFGAASFVVIVAALKLATGHLVSGGFLLVWGLAVVGLVDNFLKPYLIRAGVDIHGAVIFFALLGGLAAFGPVGLVLGPLGVAFLIAVVRIYWRDFGGRPMPEAAGKPDTKERERPAPLPS